MSAPNGTVDAGGDSSETLYEYDDASNLITETRKRIGGGSTVEIITLYQYDALNRVVRLVDALDYVTTYEYNRDGQNESIVTLGDATTPTRTRRMVYDLLGRMTTKTDAGGYVTTMRYDEVGNLVEETGPFQKPTGVNPIGQQAE